MACCGSSRGTTRYQVTDPQGTVRVYLTEPEARIALATHGGGSVMVLKDEPDTLNSK